MKIMMVAKGGYDDNKTMQQRVAPQRAPCEGEHNRQRNRAGKFIQTQTKPRPNLPENEAAPLQCIGEAISPGEVTSDGANDRSSPERLTPGAHISALGLNAPRNGSCLAPASAK